jgi:hypothetical protein
MDVDDTSLLEDVTASEAFKVSFVEVSWSEGSSFRVEQLMPLSSTVGP